VRIEEAPMMSERQVKKRAVNLFVDAGLLDEARRLQINVSETLERRLRTIVKAERQKRWLEENQEAIASINSFIDRHGLLASRLRYRPE
jgi:antitoxin CcdA